MKWTLEIYPGLQQKILSGLRRKSNPMTLMMSSLKATFPPTFCTGRRYYSQVWWRQFPYSDPNLNSQIRFCKTNNVQKKRRIYGKIFHFEIEGVKICKEWLYLEHCIIALRVVAHFAPLFTILHPLLVYIQCCIRFINHQNKRVSSICLMFALLNFVNQQKCSILASCILVSRQVLVPI